MEIERKFLIRKDDLPQDSSYLFDRFMEMMGGTDHAEK